MKKHVSPAIVILLVLVLLSGCARVTRANYAKIHSGMTMEEVVKVLGEPSDMSSIGIGPLEASTARWDGKDGSISIQFVGQKVRIKSFQSAEEGARKKD